MKVFGSRTGPGLTRASPSLRLDSSISGNLPLVPVWCETRFVHRHDGIHSKGFAFESQKQKPWFSAFPLYRGSSKGRTDSSLILHPCTITVSVPIHTGIGQGHCRSRTWYGADTPPVGRGTNTSAYA
eukprot:1381417-Rhodomonas_salina.1